MGNPGNRIRLFADAHVFDKEYQGTRTFIKEIYRQLALRCDLELFLGAYDIEKLQSVFPGSANINFIKYKSRSGLRRLLYDIPAIISTYKIQYAHFQYIIPPVKNCRFIVTIHDVIFNEFPGEFSFPYRFSKKILYARAASKADIITTVSAYSKNSIIKHLKARPSTIHILPNGINPEFFRSYNSDNSKRNILEKYGFDKYILYVSRFEKRKNHAGLLRAWLDAGLQKDPCHLVLLGHRSLPVPEFDQLLGSLPPEIKKYVFIREDINDEGLLEFYKAASLFVYPSRAEGFGISPLEAAALRIPVICSNSSAMKEFSFFGENLIDVSNEKLLAKRLRSLVDRPPPGAKLLEISEKIKEKYSWEKSATAFYNILSNDQTATA